MYESEVSKEKISVVIPVYNSEKYLTECIESVQKQTYKNLEIILVDDGSSDRSRNICGEYCRRDSRLRLITRKHKGVSAARNCGLDAMTGKYVLFLDSDDMIHPSLIEQYVIMMNKTGTDYIFCGYRPFVSLPEAPGASEAVYPELITYSAKRARELYHYGPFFRGIGGKMIRADYIGKIRFAENISWGEDTLFSYEMILKGGKVSLFNADWYYYRQHSDSACATIRDRSLEKLEYMKILRDYEYKNVNQLDNALNFAVLWEKNIIWTASSAFIRAKKERNVYLRRELKKIYTEEAANPLQKKLPSSHRAMFYISFNSPLFLYKIMLKMYHLIKQYRGGSSAPHDDKNPVFNIEQKPDRKRIAITFDATYGADNTSKILNILQKYGITATFFISGIWAEAYPQKVREILASGCEVGNHSDTHTHIKDCPRVYAEEDIENCNRKIEAAAGIRPKLIRLPFGEYNSSILELTEHIGMKAIQWSVDSLDWKETMTEEDIYSRIVSNISSGGIILCHNGGLYTPEVLKKVLDTFTKQGYEFVTVSELMKT